MTAAHWSVSGLFLVSFGLVVAEMSFGMHLPGETRRPEAALVVAATMSTLISLSRQLPIQNAFLAVTIIALGGVIAQAMGTLTAIPFGPFSNTHSDGPVFSNIMPWWIPFVWIITLLNSRGVARVILRPWRKTRTYGFRLFGLTAALCLAFDLSLEPFAMQGERYWLWCPAQPGVSWCASAISFLFWIVSTLLILAVVTPVLINKRPAEFPPDYHPVVLWCLLTILLVTGALAHRFWPAAMSGSGALLAVVCFAVHAARCERGTS